MKKAPPLLCSLWCYTLKGHKQRTLIRGSNLKWYKPLFWTSVSVTPSRLRWSRKNIPFVWLSPGDKKMGTNQLFIVWCIWSWLLWVSVKILMTFFDFGKIQVPGLASGDLWWHQHAHISCFNPWKISARKFFNSVSGFPLVLGLIKWF